MKKIISVLLALSVIMSSFAFSINAYATNYGSYCSDKVDYPVVSLPAFSEYIKGNSSNTEATSVLLYAQSDSSFYFCSGTVRNTKCKFKIENDCLKFYETGGYQYSFSIYKYTPNVSENWTLVNSGSGSWDFNSEVVSVNTVKKIKFLWTKYDSEYLDDTTYTIYSNENNTYNNGIFACYYSPSTGEFLYNDPNAKQYFSGSYINSSGSQQADVGILDDNSYAVAGNDSTQNKSSKYSEKTITSGTETANTDVYGTIAESGIKVSYPTVLILDAEPDSNGNYKAEGVCKVKGDISGTTTINVVPQDTDEQAEGVNFTMSQTGKTSLVATVTQSATAFTYAGGVETEYNNTAKTDITVSVKNATAGCWYGSYNTVVSVSSTNPYGP